MGENGKFDFSWWKRAPGQIRVLIVSFAAFSGTVTVSIAAWSKFEPYFIAHRSYVREYVDDEGIKLRREFNPTKIGVYDIQISIAKSRRSSIVDRLIQLEIDAPKSENAIDLATRRSQIERLKEEKTELDEEIKRIQVIREKH